MKNHIDENIAANAFEKCFTELYIHLYGAKNWESKTRKERQEILHEMLMAFVEATKLHTGFDALA